MKKLILSITLGATTLLNAQDKITFSYDEAGNQIQRELCINCISAKSSKKINKENASIDEPDLQKFYTEDTFSYFPNPVKEELYLQWNTTGGSRVVALHVFDLSGRLLKSISNLKSQDRQNIVFGSYPIGVYTIVLVYENQNKKSIKIIKK